MALFIYWNDKAYFSHKYGAIFFLTTKKEDSDIYWNDNATGWTVFWNIRTHFADKNGAI